MSPSHRLESESAAGLALAFSPGYKDEAGYETGRCMTPIGSYAQRYIEIRSNGSVGDATIRYEQGLLKHIKATIGHIPVCQVTSENIEECLLKVPELSEKWALERQAEWEENRKTVRWARKHGTLKKPYKPIRVAGSDRQAKLLKFLREVMNYALEKEDIVKNTAKAKFLTRVFKKSKPLIDPLMADDAARFLKEVDFKGTRPYALRHTFATLNLANGENIKTISVLMGHASSAYTLDLYAGYVPNTGLGIGTKYMNFLRSSQSTA